MEAGDFMLAHFDQRPFDAGANIRFFHEVPVFDVQAFLDVATVPLLARAVIFSVNVWVHVLVPGAVGAYWRNAILLIIMNLVEMIT